MGAIASRITSLKIVYSSVYSGADQRKYQSSASLALVWGIHRWPVNSPHKWCRYWIPLITLDDRNTLRHWGRGKMAAIFQTTFSNEFSAMLNIWNYYALPISRGHFSPNNSRKTPIPPPNVRGMGTFREFELWPKVCPRSCCECNVVLYYTATYQESISVIEGYKPALIFIILKWGPWIISQLLIFKRILNTVRVNTRL